MENARSGWRSHVFFEVNANFFIKNFSELRYSELKRSNIIISECELRSGVDLRLPWANSIFVKRGL